MAATHTSALTSSLGVDPVNKLLNVNVDSWFLGFGATHSPADDALQPPVTVRVTDQRTPGVALT